ncbi:MAG: peptidoglycan DD-metalloendopeptidase family protein, partial [Gammaproteobacteria bacterium]|nr:M23 family metallopeptidase [Gemmatimonadota bacterium]NIU79256.1 peptidoglycan DD-metalloendopeptidase family protein [Gammaproteobacteria bacterium]NIY12299.1 peptidoglycan DD-metalloendopeptidase family protein [Gemmatimonadota bacterium]
TPVVAAAAGVIVRLDSNPAGGTTIYERSLDGRTVFYYAHLQRRVAGLAVGDLVRQGDTLAYVGDTGNARGIPHLHFAVYAVADPNEVSDGRHLDPYPLLVDTRADPEG